jgi:hypothetical protein
VAGCCRSRAAGDDRGLHRATICYQGEADKMKLDISVERSVAGCDSKDYDLFCINIELTRKELLDLSCQDDGSWKSITDIFDALIQKERR